VASNKAEIFGTPKFPTAFDRTMLVYRPSLLKCRFGEFSGGAFRPTFKGVGGGKTGVNVGTAWHDAARLFEPDDRLVSAGLQQMH
jgi:hypothetical protein